jgi:hypothetical protein
LSLENNKEMQMSVTFFPLIRFKEFSIMEVLGMLLLNGTFEFLCVMNIVMFSNYTWVFV